MLRIRNRLLSLLAAGLLVLVACTAVAQARGIRVTGQQTSVTPSAAAVQFLTANHIAIAPVAPASLANGSIILPITGGRVNRRMRGVLRHSGGFTLTRAGHTITALEFTLVRRGGRAWLRASVDGHRIRLARVTDLKVSASDSTATATGELRLTRAAARVLDGFVGSDAVSPGLVFGTVASTITFA